MSKLNEITSVISASYVGESKRVAYSLPYPGTNDVYFLFEKIYDSEEDNYTSADLDRMKKMNNRWASVQNAGKYLDDGDPFEYGTGSYDLCKYHRLETYDVYMACVVHAKDGCF